MNKKIICLIFSLTMILLLTTITLTSAVPPEEPGLRRCFHILCANYEEFWHCGSEVALGNRIRAVCGR